MDAAIDWFGGYSVILEELFGSGKSVALKFGRFMVDGRQLVLSC